MRYESIGENLTLVPEISAVIQNMGKIAAVSAQMTTSGKTTTVLLYPGQKVTYQNSTVYLKSVKAGSTIRVRIDPLSYESVSGDGGTVTIGEKTYRVASDASFNAMLDDVGL